MTNHPDELLYARAMRRAGRLMLALSAAGTAAAFAWRGWTWGAGFAVGAIASWLNFRWLKGVADSFGGKRPRAYVMVFGALRYLLLVAGAYVILRYSPISLSAALAGLFVAVAAVIVEAVFELAYARK